MLNKIAQFLHSLKVVGDLRVLNFAAPFKSRDELAVKSFHEYVTQRTHYARKNDWPVNNVHFDLDHYDENKNTRYVLVIKKKSNPRVHVNSGMRLTRVNTMQDSLSYSMWDYAIEKEQFLRELELNSHLVDEINDAAAKNELWDLTRLMTHTALLDKKTWRDRSHTLAGLLVLLGSGVGYCGKNAYWFFTCDSKFKRFLDRLGLDHTVIAHGKISESDKGDNYLCYSKIQPAFEKLYKEKPLIFFVARAGHKRSTANTR
jgi:hypothetical protein